MLRGGERGHVDADLGDQHLSGALLDAGDRHQQLTLAGERADPRLDLVREAVDRFVEEVNVREDLGDDHRVLVVETSLEGFAERGELRAELSSREVGQHRWVGRSGDERVEHRPTGFPEDVRSDAVELDPGVLQDLVQPGASR